MKTLRFMLAVCVFSLGLSALAEISMTATPAKSGNVVTSVSLAFGGVPEGGAYALFVAYGAKDAGDDIRCWDKYAKVADVTQATASYDYAAMPDGWGFKYHAIRFFLFDANADLPFDRALEYVEATGTQHVLTDYTPTGRDVIEADVQITSADTGWHTIFSSRYSTTSRFDLLLSTVYRFDYFTHHDDTALCAAYPAERHRVRCGDGNIFVEGRPEGVPVEVKDDSAGKSLALFALRATGTSTAVSTYGKAKLYGFRIWSPKDGVMTLALDLVPCAKDGVVGLYDRIGGAFMSSASADALVASSSDGFYFTETAAAATATIADVASLSVTAALNASGGVDVAFPALPGACKLFAAYADRDAGDDVRAWEKTEFVGDLVAGTTACSWALPDGWGRKYHYLRFFLIDMSKAPCDRQLTFIQGQGAQCIELSDVTPTGRASIHADVTVDNAATHTIWSGRGGGKPVNSLFFYGGSTHVRWDYDGTSKDNLDCVLGRHVLAADVNVFSCDGDVLATASKTNANEFGSSLLLFALNGSATLSNYGTFKLHSFKVWRNKTIAFAPGYGQSLWRDLLPAEKSGAAGLYDRVSGRFYGNAGSGSFAVGGEVLCADGLQVGGSAALFSADGRTMTVTRNYTDGKLSSVRLDFAAAESPMTYHLYAAFDVQDKGEDIDDWAEVRYLDPIAATDDSYTYAFPAWWGCELQAVRFFLMADAPCTEKMPYDKRLEYIQGSGSAYIQTEFYPMGRTRVAMDCEVVAENAALFSARKSYSFIAFCQPDLTIRFDGFRSGTQFTSETHPVGRYNLVFDGAGAFVDGVQEIQAKVLWPTEDPKDVQLALFAYQSSAGEVQSAAKGRHKLYSFKGWRNVQDHPESLDLDLIPCEKDGRPGVYDRASGEFLPSETTDDFIAGREIPLAPTVSGVTRACTYLKSGMLLLFR